MLRPTLIIQTVSLHESDGDDARRLGADLYELLTRPESDPLAFGAGIPVLSGVAAENVDVSAAETVVLIPVLGKKAFLLERDEIISRIVEWHKSLGEGHVLVVPTAELWRNVEAGLPGKQLLSELYGQDDARRQTLDEIVLAVTRLLDPESSGEQLFVSHSKKDLESTSNAAKLIHDYVVNDTTGKAFFDAADLRPGEALGKQIDAAASRGVFVAVRGDAYSTRDWCQRELLTAKRLGLPTLTVDILNQGEQRTSPYGGNGPSIVWDGNPAAVVSRAMVEWLREAHFKLEAQRICISADLPETTRILSRPPELLDMAQGTLESSHAQLVLHPDPELSVLERQILNAAHPRLHIVTPTTAFRRLLQRDGSASVSAPLEGIQVAMSLSDSPDANGDEGFTGKHIEDATIYIARSLISAGASIAYGGDFRSNGFTPLLCELVSAYNETAARPADFLHGYLGAPINIEDAPDLPMNLHHLVHSKDVKEDAIMPPNSDEDQHPAALYFNDMRQVMAKRTDARIILGGNSKPRTEEAGSGYSGRYPGVVEEAWRTLEAEQPLYVLGAFGGASALVAKLLDETDEIPASLVDETWMESQFFRDNAAAIDADPYREKLGLPLRMQDLADAVRELGRTRLETDEASISWNGLNVEDNRTLFRSRDPLILASLVLKGLLAATRERGEGKLEIELVHGSVTSANQLDAFALSTFDNVPLGGAGAALDQAIGGRASHGHAKGNSLIHLEAPDVDADWLYLASLGPMSNVDRLEEVVEQAARETARQADRHGFRRLGVVTFGGSVADPDSVTEAMLRGFSDLAGRGTLVWFETVEERFEKLRDKLAGRESVKLTTRRITTEVARKVVRDESLILQLALEDDQLAVTTLPPAGTGIASSRVVALRESELAQFGQGGGLSSRDTPSLDTLSSRGNKLAKLLLGKEADEIIARCKTARVVVIHDVASSRLPFEILTTATSRPAAEAGISRRLTVSDAPVERLFARPPHRGKLDVVLVVNPTGDLPGTEMEADAVRATLAQHSRVNLREFRGAEATKKALLETLASADVLHYCGHAFFDGPGDTESGLVLAGKEKLTLRDLTETSQVPRVVFFNACEAGRVRGSFTTEAAAFAELILKCGVEAYVGTYWQVGDSPAAEFATGVYARLADGATLESAVTQSRADLFKNEHSDWANYILYGDGRFTLTKPSKE